MDHPPLHRGLSWDLRDLNAESRTSDRMLDEPDTDDEEFSDAESIFTKEVSNIVARKKLEVLMPSKRDPRCFEHKGTFATKEKALALVKQLRKDTKAFNTFRTNRRFTCPLDIRVRLVEDKTGFHVKMYHIITQVAYK